MHLHQELKDLSRTDDLVSVLQAGFGLTPAQVQKIIEISSGSDEYRLVGLQDQTGLLAFAGFKLTDKVAVFHCFTVRESDRLKGMGRNLLALLKQHFELYRMDAKVRQPFQQFFERCGFTCLQRDSSATKEPIYSCFWLDGYQLLHPNFYFPQPAIEQAILPGIRQSIDILRLDQIHPLLSGNKWFKLRWNLIQAQQNEQSRIITFGGAWSNHIFATAAAGSLLGFETIGFIRGEKPEQLSPVLKFAKNCGMHLKFISRSAYRNKHQPDFINEIQKNYVDALIIPEGGANQEGSLGARDIMRYVPEYYSLVATACGTASTLAGLVSAQTGQKFLGVSALKGGAFLYDEVKKRISSSVRETWEIDVRHFCRGFAKKTPELETFMAEFRELNPIPIEHTYTAKLLYALSQRYQANEILREEKILALHTGGIYPWNHTDYLLQDSLVPVLE